MLFVYKTDPATRVILSCEDGDPGSQLVSTPIQCRLLLRFECAGFGIERNAEDGGGKGPDADMQSFGHF